MPIFVIINFLLYAATLAIYYKTTKRIDTFFIIISTYALIAGCGIFYCLYGQSTYNHLSLLGFLYLYLVIIVFAWPFMHIHSDFSKTTIGNNFEMTAIIAIFFISGSISLIYYIPRIIILIQLNDWGSVRQDVYNNFDGISLYTNQLDRLCKNIFSYMNPFGMVWLFYQLTKPKFNKILVLSAFIILVLNSISSAMVIASRGMVISFVCKSLIIFIIFKNTISQYIKKKIYFFFTIILSVIIIYSLAVTDSRFGDDANDSLLSYFGHPMVAFNSGIFNSLHDYANGRYFFKWFYDLLGFDSSINFIDLGSTHGNAFITFVGCFLIDFGPAGTLIIALLFAWGIGQITRKNNLQLTDIIILYYAASWLIDGVFVSSRSESLGWVMLFILCAIIKIFNHKYKS